MALPEVTEKQHHAFKAPKWQARGNTFLGIGRDETTAVFWVTKETATPLPRLIHSVPPPYGAGTHDAASSGLEVHLADVPPERIEALIREWVAHTPKTLVTESEPAGLYQACWAGDSPSRRHRC